MDCWSVPDCLCTVLGKNLKIYNGTFGGSTTQCYDAHVQITGCQRSTPLGGVVVLLSHTVIPQKSLQIFGCQWEIVQEAGRGDTLKTYSFPL